jgi:hypothetical protein
VNALAGKWGVFRAEMTRRLIRTGYFERGFVYMITKYGEEDSHGEEGTVI